MRIPLFYACLGLTSISSLAGCGLFSCRDNCASNGQPVERMVARKDVANAQTISGWSRPIGAPAEPSVVIETPKQLPPSTLPRPIPALPAINYKDPEEPAPVRPVAPVTPVTPDQGRLEPDQKNLPPRGTSGVLIDSAFLPEAHRQLLNIDKLVVGHGDAVIPPPPESGAYIPSAKDNSAPIQPANSGDYKSLTGQVQMWRQTVRLRYAPIDQEDIYGGFVVLDGGPELTRLREGQRVRIRGVLIAPDGRNGVAHYQVQALEILD